MDANRVTFALTDKQQEEVYAFVMLRSVFEKMRLKLSAAAVVVLVFYLALMQSDVGMYAWVVLWAAVFAVSLVFALEAVRIVVLKKATGMLTEGGLSREYIAWLGEIDAHEFERKISTAGANNR